MLDGIANDFRSSGAKHQPGHNCANNEVKITSGYVKTIGNTKRHGQKMNGSYINKQLYVYIVALERETQVPLNVRIVQIRRQEHQTRENLLLDQMLKI